LTEAYRQRYLRLLPAVEKVLHEKTLLEIGETIPRKIVVEAVQEVISNKRNLIQAAAQERDLQHIDTSSEKLAQEALKKIQEKMSPNLRAVLNATGVLLHTNLGRALLADDAINALVRVGKNYCNLELSLETGKRSSRYEHVEELLCRLTGADGALVVNNNAGAVFLALNSLSSGREAIVSRGELVEIGGSFRLPEVMASSGTALTEVGTTNKCFLRDYRKAINENTALLLKVHTSNYKIVGFTAAVKLSSLVKLAREHDIAVMEDLGSGVLIDLSRYGLPYEPRVQDSVLAGADVITFSGDKLLGGPQVGIIIGKKPYIDLIKKNQLLRALRVDKLTLAALEATLRLYFDEERALREIPILRMLTISSERLVSRAEAIVLEIGKRPHADFAIGIAREKARVGGGSLPLVLLNSCQVFLEPKKKSSAFVVEKLRQSDPPVLVRVRKNRILFDMRSFREEDDELLLKTLSQVLAL
jgi:L-seryl-tRNA(Ser) seleniumtransferase